MEYSPNIVLDWTSKDEVKDYYNSFDYWKCRVSNGDIDTPKLYEIKDNMILLDGEYYLPYAYKFTKKAINKKDYEDGFMFGYCVKVQNKGFSSEDAIIVNVFVVRNLVSKEDIEYNELKINNKKTLSDIDYLKSIKYSKLNSSDLALLRTNFCDLLDKILFPFTSNGVTLRLLNKPSLYTFDSRLTISYRNRNGSVVVDNGGSGYSTFGDPYYLILKSKSFDFNECQYSLNLRVKNFDINLLDSITSEISSKWDRAIENNAKYR